jgi:hypothetical protein
VTYLLARWRCDRVYPWPLCRRWHGPLLRRQPGTVLRYTIVGCGAGAASGGTVRFSARGGATRPAASAVIEPRCSDEVAVIINININFYNKLGYLFT